MSNYPIGLSVEEGLSRLLEVANHKKIEKVPPSRAHNRVLAEDIKAVESIPPFPRSPYDGYAFRADDIKCATKENPVTLEIIEEIPAGHAATKEVGEGQAIKILTGAPIPNGADTIEKFEVTEFTESSVTFFAPVEKGSNIVPEGEDVRVGDVVLEKGTIITAAGCGILAGLGQMNVPVYEEITASVISTGDELIEVSESLSPGKLRNSSAYTIKALMESWGINVYLRGIVKDDPDLIAEAVREECEHADVVITTGGVSVGDYDCLQSAMEVLSADVLFWKLKMKPGSAFLASVYKDTPIISLSGNPSAAIIALMLVGKPTLLKMTGRSDYETETFTVKLEADFPKKSFVRRFIPGCIKIINGEAYLRAMSKQGNGMLSPLTGVDILGEIPEGSPEVSAGSVIKAYKLY